MSNKITALGAAKPKAQMGLGAFLVKGVKMSENKILAASAPTRAVAVEAKAKENASSASTNTAEGAGAAGSTTAAARVAAASPAAAPSPPEPTDEMSRSALPARE